MLAKTPIKIPEEDIRKFNQKSEAFLKSVKWKPEDLKIDKSEDPKYGNVMMLNSLLHEAQGTDGADEKKLFELFTKIDGRDTVVSEDVSFVANAILRGVSIGIFVSEQYHRASGAKDLKDRGESNLTPEQKDLLFKKQSVGAAILLFVTSSYVVWKLLQYKEKEVESIALPSIALPNLHLTNQSKAIQCLLYYFGIYIDPAKGNMVRTPLELIKFSILYFKMIMEEIQVRKSSMQYLSHFEEFTYKAEFENFVVDGFKVDAQKIVKVAEILPVKFNEIVGNPEAKLQGERIAQRLILYDFKTEKNPILDPRLGGFPDISAGDGEPGTGKTMLLAATGGAIQKYAQALDIPYQIVPLPGNMVSSFQGLSADNITKWFQTIMNPKCITFAPVDDAEGPLRDRALQGSSEGDRAITTVFLQLTEGVTAIKRGNTVIYFASNLLEQVDPAVLSRIKNRARIPGAVTAEDWIDQDYLWWIKQKEGNESFINLTYPEGYQFMATQNSFKKFSQSTFSEKDIKDDRLNSIVVNALKKYGNDITDVRLSAEVLERSQKIYKFVTSRELRNIHSTIDFKLMDIDLPGSWLTDPKECVLKPYEVKVQMLLELKRQSIAGSNFAEIKWQETIRHLDTLVSIKNKGRQRKIDAYIEELEIRDEAEKLYQARKKELDQK